MPTLGRGTKVISLSLGMLVVACALALRFGTDAVDWSLALRDPSSVSARIVFDARLPRVVLAMIAGAGLSAAGVSFQAVLRNPLAEPYVLGVSGGAALGATIALLLGLGGTTLLGAGVVPLAAMAGGVLTTGLVYAIARATGGLDASTLLLSGVVLNAVASAWITFLKTLISASKAQEILYWLVGYVDVQDTRAIFAVFVYVTLGVVVLLRDAGKLNTLALGSEVSASLGVEPKRVEARTFFACSLIVGAIVSLTGLIGFVGLVVPHLLRRLAGPDTRILLPASLLFGGATLVLCDLLSRVLFRYFGTEPPVGAITALVGGPVFLVVLVGRRRGTYGVARRRKIGEVQARA